MLFAIVALVLVACDGRSKLRVEKDAMYKVVQATNSHAPMRTNKAERRLIKTGSLEFRTDDWKSTKKQIAAICDSLDAYTADESLNNLNDRISYHQILRVPTSRFEELVNKIEQSSGGLFNKSISVEDVTEEYIDIEVRVRNKKEMEIRYLELLKIAKSVSEMLDIERNISDVRTDIESMEGKLKHMQNRIALSTLDVTYYEITGVKYGFVSKLVNSLSNGWQNLLVVIVGMANIWPFIFLFSIAAFWLRRRLSLKTENR